jgi:cystathionine beta-lyase/cystathionine gamma-synthase
VTDREEPRREPTGPGEVSPGGDLSPATVSRGTSTRAVHAGEEAVATLPPRRPAGLPVFQTAPWTFADSAELESAFAAVPGDRSALYSRYSNPTVRVLEEKVAALEGADDAVAFASGMAAISTTLGALLASGDHLLAAADLYGGTDAWLAALAVHQPEVTVERAPLGALAARVDELAGACGGDAGSADAGTARRLAAVYLETPSNPLLACCDLAALAAACRRLGEVRGAPVRLLVDGTLASPAVQTPLAHGADLVLHSATKFLGGHSDVTAGVVAGGAGLVEQVRRRAIVAGPCLDPHAGFLVARGVQTLVLRVERQSANAARLAARLASHPAVARVHYPGLPAAAGFDPVAAGQMRSGGPMLAFDLAGGLPAARALVDALEIFRIIPSLGGVESGVVLPAATSHRNLSAAERAERGIADGLVRMSCGIEDGADLEADLAAALRDLPA